MYRGKYEHKLKHNSTNIQLEEQKNGIKKLNK